MSNLLKGYWVSVKDESKVVDTNELVQIKVKEEEEKRARMRQMLEQTSDLEDGFQEGLPVTNIDLLLSEDGSAVIGQEQIDSVTPISEEQEALDEINDEIRARAAELEIMRNEADTLLQNAQMEAQSIKDQILEEAKNEGYQQGYEAGMREIEAMRAELEEQARQMEAQFQETMEMLEPQFVDNITSIYEHIFKVDLASYKSIVSQLLIEAINGSAGAKNIIVHISREDFSDVTAQKEDILASTGTTSDNVEFIQDATLQKAGCMIETDNGIFDCSLDVELAELKRKLMILAYRR